MLLVIVDTKSKPFLLLLLLTLLLNNQVLYDQLQSLHTTRMVSSSNIQGNGFAMFSCIFILDFVLILTCLCQI